MSHRVSFAVLALIMSTTTFAASKDLQPGVWEITTETSMPGMPIQIPPQTEKRCYTTADLTQAQDAIQQGGYANCKVKNFQENGDTATWAIACSGEPAMSGKGKMTTTATSFVGAMDSVVKYPGGAMAMTNKWRAKRVGSCK